MTTGMVASGEESSGVATLNSGGAGLILYQSGVARTKLIDDDVRLPPLPDYFARIAETVCGGDFEGAAHSEAGSATLVGDFVIYLLLAIFLVMLVLALVVVPDNGLMLSDPIGFARGG
jgi:hypothetical protein